MAKRASIIRLLVKFRHDYKSIVKINYQADDQDLLVAMGN
ncbi:hypothetical protein CASFOL_030985 [Castilleja foliolosa]|uniref:Uncharacterized protein n=1 Tax=Castilleja foliolosa TaxID=1961234 RepID=A0ABD3C865_9LAMI